jgi:hypothetical protein
MRENNGSKVASYSFSSMVNVFLGLITKRLLDTLIDAYRKDEMKPYNWCALLTMVIILAHNFILFFKISADGHYVAVLQRALDRNVMKLIGATLAIMVYLYIMAFWFSLEADYYVGLSVGLVFLWLVFDYYCIRSVGDSIAELGDESGSLNSLLQSAKVWCLCDIVLGTLLLFLFIALKKNALSATSVAATVTLLFYAMGWLVAHGVDMQRMLGGPGPRDPSESSILPDAYLGEDGKPSS